MELMELNEAGLHIRSARPEEAKLLTELIMRSKAHWGYSADLLETWRPTLTLDRQTILRNPVYCAEDMCYGTVCGISHFYRLSDQEMYLDLLFVEPAYMGRGVGARLWRHMIARATELGVRRVVFSADPNARPFYERMGATVVGWEDSSVPGRRLPLMRYDISSQ